MSELNRIRVLLADDHAVFRLGMRELLADDTQIDVVAEARSGREAIEQTAAVAPDVVVMDVQMPDVDGISATRQIKQSSPATGVLVVSAYDDDDKVFESMQAGASGYFLKDDPPPALLQAVHAASAGEMYLGQVIARHLMNRVAHGQTVPGGRPHSLSPRETKVLQLMAQGKRNREIAESLELSPRTVGNHVANLFDKIHVRDRYQAIMYAVRNGIVDV